MGNNNDQGKFDIEIRDTYHKHDYPPITQRQIDEGKQQAFNNGAGMVVCAIFAGFVLLFILAMISHR